MIHLCSVADHSYVMPTVIMLTSVKLNKPHDVCCAVHILGHGIDEKDRKRFAALNSEDFLVEILEPPVKNYEGLNFSSGHHYTRAALLKYYIADFLPDVEKVLYLDGDILVKKDISRLYYIDIESFYGAAVCDIAGVMVYDLASKLGVEYYINSGVILLNLSMMRKEKVAAKLLEANESLPAFSIFTDQDAFNLAFNKKVKILSPLFNAMPGIYRPVGKKPYAIGEINEFYGTNFLNTEELEEDACLIHFAGPKKPWQYINVPYAFMWAEYYARSPYAGVDLCRDVYLSYGDVLKELINYVKKRIENAVRYRLKRLFGRV